MDNKMKDSDIIKALQGAVLNANSVDCKIWSIEVHKLENALDLINRQKAEIERLTASERLSLIKLFRAMGAPYSQIAKSLGVSRQRIQQICKIYRIKKGEKNGRCEVDKTCHKHI